MYQDTQPQSELKRDELAALVYSSWTLRSHFFRVIILLIIAASVSTVVWSMSNGSVLVTSLSFFLITMMVGNGFLPRRIEFNEIGIYRSLGSFLGNRWHCTAWEEIVSYKKLNGGVLLILNQERFTLDSFRSVFIPVPSELFDNVEKRLSFYVDDPTL